MPQSSERERCAWRRRKSAERHRKRGYEMDQRHASSAPRLMQVPRSGAERQRHDPNGVYVADKR
jgi:hypothetical protein